MRSESEPWEEGRDEPPGELWDAHDVRRQHDQMAPPLEPCECFCQYCHRTFMSDRIWFQRVRNDRDGFAGFWMCPTPNCFGKGFTFDIFPADPNHPANDGWFSFSDDEEYDDDDDGPVHKESFDVVDDADDLFAIVDGGDEPEPAEYDPAEPQYKMMDDWCSDDDDLEGEEWKHGLEPGQRPEPAKPDWVIEEEKKYDEPDRRPRELDASELERPERTMGEDDIPF